MQLIGRRSSVFTRMALMFAAELGVPLPLEPVPDMNRTEPEFYAGNPALKLPVLRLDGSVLFGALTICRAIAERCNSPRLIVWPEQMTDILSRNAQELVWSAPMLAIYPGLLIFVTVIAFNFVGDGLQDALDPRAGP